MNTNEELQEIYRRKVLDHSKQPHNCRRSAEANRTATGFNPLCGDKITVFLNLENDAAEDICFEGTGCAICIASASMMTEAVMGNNTDAIRKLSANVEQMLDCTDAAPTAELGDLQALAGVRHYPSRIKCARLPWVTLEQALMNKTEQVSTER